MSQQRVIPGELGEGESASPWRLPDVNDPAPPREKSGLRRPGMSVEELEQLQKSAYEEAFAEGRREGYEAGFGEGREAGMKQAESEGRKLVTSLKGVLDAVSEPSAELDDAVEDELVTMVFAIAQQVIRRELHTQPGEVIAVIREAVGLLPMNARQVQVQVHPDDARFIREALGEGDMAWQLVEDPAVSRGGCIVNTPSSRVDATLENRLGAIAAELLGDDRRDDFQTETPPEESPE